MFRALKALAAISLIAISAPAGLHSVSPVDYEAVSTASPGHVDAVLPTPDGALAFWSVAHGARYGADWLSYATFVDHDGNTIGGARSLAGGRAVSVAVSQFAAVVILVGFGCDPMINCETFGSVQVIDLESLDVHAIRGRYESVVFNGETFIASGSSGHLALDSHGVAVASSSVDRAGQLLVPLRGGFGLIVPGARMLSRFASDGQLISATELPLTPSTAYAHAVGFFLHDKDARGLWSFDLDGALVAAFENPGGTLIGITSGERGLLATYEIVEAGERRVYARHLTTAGFSDTPQLLLTLIDGDSVAPALAMSRGLLVGWSPRPRSQPRVELASRGEILEREEGRLVNVRARAQQPAALIETPSGYVGMWFEMRAGLTLVATELDAAGKRLRDEPVTLLSNLPLRMAGERVSAATNGEIIVVAHRNVVVATDRAGVPLAGTKLELAADVELAGVASAGGEFLVYWIDEEKQLAAVRLARDGHAKDHTAIPLLSGVTSVIAARLEAVHNHYLMAIHAKWNNDFQRISTIALSRDGIPLSDATLIEETARLVESLQFDFATDGTAGLLAVVRTGEIYENPPRPRLYAIRPDATIAGMSETEHYGITRGDLYRAPTGYVMQFERGTLLFISGDDVPIVTRVMPNTAFRGIFSIAATAPRRLATLQSVGFADFVLGHTSRVFFYAHDPARLRAVSR